MSNTIQSDSDQLKHIISQICKKLGYFKETQDNIITKCIYCGDSKNKYTGHFYIWKQYPVAFCFRCSISTSYNLVKWAEDLESIIGTELSLLLKKTLKNNFLVNINDSYAVFSNKESRNLNKNIIELTNNKIHDTKNMFCNELERRNFKNYEILLNYIEHNVINVTFFEDVIYNHIFVGLRSVFGSGYHLRNLKTNQTLQKRLAKNDVFLATNNYTPTIVFVVEGLYDALAMMLFLINNNFKIADFGFMVSSVGFFTSDSYKYLQCHIPRSLIIIYDKDVDNKIIEKQKSSYRYLSGITNLSIYKCKVYKDIAETVVQINTSNSIFDYLQLL